MTVKNANIYHLGEKCPVGFREWALANGACEVESHGEWKKNGCPPKQNKSEEKTNETNHAPNRIQATSDLEDPRPTCAKKRCWQTTDAADLVKANLAHAKLSEANLYKAR